ncbi:unnamed protein product [Camellia sinensis]
MKFGKVMEHMEHEVKVEGSYERSWKIIEYEMEEVEEKYQNLISLEMENLTNEALEAPGDFKNFPALNCIDLSSHDIHNSVSLLKQECLDSGFFYVINHGISQEFMDEVFNQSKSFFDLPVSEKMKVLRNKKHRGYTPLFNERSDPVNQTHGDYKEGYYIGIEALEVAKAISRIIALALNLEVDFFDRQEMLGKPIANLRLLHYEGRVSDPMKGIYGAGAHSDFGLITLLATDDVFGLQICKDKDAKPQKWEFVAPLKGALEQLYFQLSTLHRVVGNGQERYSIAYFVEPNHDCLVECLPTCQSQENPPKGFLLSNVKLTCSSGTRKLALFSSDTKNDTPNSVVNITGIFASSVEHKS